MSRQTPSTGRLKSAARSPIFDVAIVGGGIAGLYSAWRLLTSKHDRAHPRIVILEKADRLGGRLKTLEVRYQKTRVLVEEGGMRFLKEHAMLLKLLDDFSLTPKIKKFGMGDEQNAYYLRGKRFTRGDAKRSDHKIWNSLYSLAKTERGKSPYQIVEEVMARVLRSSQIDKDMRLVDRWKPENPHAWSRFRQIEYPRGSGLRLYQWGFRALLEHEGLSNGCIQMLMDTGGFTIPYEDMVGAGTGLQLIASFPDEPDFYTLRDGYDELPRRIGKKLLAMGARVLLNHPVDRLRHEKSTFKLLSSTQSMVAAKQVIVALPVAPLRKLLTNTTGVRGVRERLKDLEHVIHMPLTKINLFFQSRWWKDRVRNGGCFTDLPLAQVYFFDLDAVARDRKFTVITIYSDGRRGNYWRQLQQLGPDYRGGDPNLSVLRESRTLVCKDLVVSHAMRQLRLMFDQDSIPMPLFATISMWGGDDLLGEGDHQWAVGADDEMIRDRLTSVGDDLFLCGEAISDYQDWVEGALRSSDRTLQEGFGLPPYLRTPSGHQE